MDDPGLHGGVVACLQVIEDLQVQGGVLAGAGRLDGGVGPHRTATTSAAQSSRPWGPSFVTALQCRITWAGTLLDAGEPGEMVLAAGAAVGDQVPAHPRRGRVHPSSPRPERRAACR